jgi:hypothetical protein
MMDTHSRPAPSLGERILVFLIALAWFGYEMYRLCFPWGPWEGDRWPRIAEASLVGVFVLWALGYILWPRIVAGEADQTAGDQAEAASREADR